MKRGLWVWTRTWLMVIAASMTQQTRRGPLLLKQTAVVYKWCVLDKGWALRRTYSRCYQQIPSHDIFQRRWFCFKYILPPFSWISQEVRLFCELISSRWQNCTPKIDSIGTGKASVHSFLTRIVCCYGKKTVKWQQIKYPHNPSYLKQWFVRKWLSKMVSLDSCKSRVQPVKKKKGYVQPQVLLCEKGLVAMVFLHLTLYCLPSSSFIARHSTECVALWTRHVQYI